jgi:23S rRNA G2069 N7-methylase RlmK/C1962 C5-methylase RlmI
LPKYFTLKQGRLFLLQQINWFRDGAFCDDQMRARTGHAAHNFAVLRHITLNLIRLAPVKRKDGLKVRRLIAATSDNYHAQLLDLYEIHAIAQPMRQAIWQAFSNSVTLSVMPKT